MEFEPLMSLLKISRSVSQLSYKNFGGETSSFMSITNCQNFHNKLRFQLIIGQNKK